MNENFFELVIHPESIIHSIVTFKDGSSICQMSNPDMRVPIANAMSHEKDFQFHFSQLILIILSLTLKAFQ